MSGFGLVKNNLTGFTPLQLGPGTCVQWLHANRGVTLVSTKVSQWNDLSGRGNHCTQGTDANRPTVQSSAINGLPTIAFTNPQTLLHSLRVQAPSTIVVVAKSAANPGVNYGSIGSWSAGLGGIFVFGVASGFNQWGVYANGNALSGASLNAFKRCVAVIRAANDIDLRTNGSSVTSTSGTTLYVVTSQIGAGFTDGTQCLEGEIAEIIVFNRALLATECQRLEGYLAVQYGL